MTDDAVKTHEARGRLPSASPLYVSLCQTIGIVGVALVAALFAACGGGKSGWGETPVSAAGGGGGNGTAGSGSGLGSPGSGGGEADAGAGWGWDASGLSADGGIDPLFGPPAEPLDRRRDDPPERLLAAHRPGLCDRARPVGHRPDRRAAGVPRRVLRLSRTDRGGPRRLPPITRSRTPSPRSGDRPRRDRDADRARCRSSSRPG